MWQIVVPGSYIKDEGDHFDLLQIVDNSYASACLYEVPKDRVVGVPATYEDLKSATEKGYLLGANWDINSPEELADYLRRVGAPTLNIPARVEISDMWKKYETGLTKPTYARRLAGEVYQCLFVDEWDGEYHIMLWEIGHTLDREKLELFLDFGQTTGNDPQDELHMYCFEAVKHGSSGMDKTHCNLGSLQEVNKILKEKYAFTFEHEGNKN